MDRLKDLLNSLDLQKVLEVFFKTTGLRASLVDLSGSPLLRPACLADSAFCQTVHSSANGQAKCQACYARAGIEAAKFGEPYIFRCHAGLIAWAAPILINSQHIATIICGQVLMWEPEEFFWIELEEMTQGLNIAFAKLVSAASQLEIVPPDRVKAAAELLFIIANYIMQAGALTLRQRQLIAEQQARINQEIQNRKILEEILSKKERHATATLEKEDDLLYRVRIRDIEGANRVLDALLADIVTQSSGQVSKVQVRLLELLTLLSRATINAGADSQRVLRLNYQFMRELSRIESMEQMCYLIGRAKDAFLEQISSGGKKGHSRVLEPVMQYIRENFRRSDLILEEIAQVVFLNPCYLSHLFKREMGCTITDYITKVRVEEAKRLLRNDNIPVSEVGMRVGYEDPSYFSKIFKKMVKYSPSKYREQFKSSEAR